MTRKEYAGLNRQSIDCLIDNVLRELDAPKNRGKREQRPYPHFSMFMEENIAFAKLFGYDFNRCLTDAEFNLAQQLQNRLFCLEHLDGDWEFTPDVQAYPGLYFEYSLFGLEIGHTTEGVPLIQSDHPLTRDPDLSLIPPYSFETSGILPEFKALYEHQRRLAGDRVNVLFPAFVRSGLDIAIQLRGYENWIMDTIERPRFVQNLMQTIVEHRIAYTLDVAEYLGEPMPETVPMADDWVNIPYITPAIFEEFVLPYIQRLAVSHGSGCTFHTCGCQDGIVSLLAGIQGLRVYEASPWTSLDEVVAKIPADMPLSVVLHSNKHVLICNLDDVRSRLVEILTKTNGRDITIIAGGLQPLGEDHGALINRLHDFAAVAREVCCEYTVEMAKEERCLHEHKAGISIELLLPQ